MFLSRFVNAIRNQSKDTLRAWSYQCESILAQRSRRIQQLLSFYQRVYGTQGLKQLWRSYYRRELQPPLNGIMLSALGVVGVTSGHNCQNTGGNNNSGTSNTGNSVFDWAQERLSLSNFDICHQDLEFLSKLPVNTLCERCKAKKMKFCYCTYGNQRCLSDGAGRQTEPTIRACQRSLGLSKDGIPDGNARIKAEEEHTWEPYFSKDSFSIWRREERSSMYSYKVYARFDDITADDFLHVQTDLDYRRQWDDTAVRLEMISEDPVVGTNSHLIYWEMQWPRLFANRDYIYCRRFVRDEKRKVILLCNRATKHGDYPVISGKVRVNDYWSFMVIKPYRNFHEPGLHFVLTYYDDPGVSIPQNIKSWVTQKQMPEFLTKMYVATKNCACARAMDMKDMFSNFALIDNEYTANASRGSWINALQLRKRNRRKVEDTRDER